MDTSRIACINCNKILSTNESILCNECLNDNSLIKSIYLINRKYKLLLSTIYKDTENGYRIRSITRRLLQLEIEDTYKEDIKKWKIDNVICKECGESHIAQYKIPTHFPLECNKCGKISCLLDKSND